MKNKQSIGAVGAELSPQSQWFLKFMAKRHPIGICRITELPHDAFELSERIIAECFTVMAEKSPIIAAMRRITGPSILGLRYFPYE